MTYRKLLFRITAFAFAFFLCVAFLSIEFLLPALNTSKQDSQSILLVPMVLLGIFFNLIPFAVTVAITALLPQKVLFAMPIAVFFYLLYFTAITHLLFVKFRSGTLAHPLRIPGMRHRLIFLMVLMVLAGLGIMGIASD